MHEVSSTASYRVAMNVKDMSPDIPNRVALAPVPETFCKHVFEINFHKICPSSQQHSGVSLRKPVIVSHHLSNKDRPQGRPD